MSAPDVRQATHRPSFLITIDTEGDDQWSRRGEVTTENARFLPRFQELCERYGLKPTYLTNYEMAKSPAFQPFGREVLRRGTAEIGMHLHAWNSPPHKPLTTDDRRHAPYLIEHPEAVMREKVGYLTALLEDTFAVKMTGHRAGRWSFNETYARVLLENGYETDCSVTPHISWENDLGDPNGAGGTDYTAFPERPYRVDLGNISREGDGPLLEVPMTIVAGAPWRRTVGGMFPAASLPGRVAGRLDPQVRWLRPTGRNRKAMRKIVEQAVAERREHVEFMLHSSELMPGGSPGFPRARDIEVLYSDLDALFQSAGSLCRGTTLSEFQRQFCARLLAAAQIS